MYDTKYSLPERLAIYRKATIPHCWRKVSKIYAAKYCFNQKVKAFFELLKNHILTHKEISSDVMRDQAFVGNFTLRNNLID